ncbi:hypothetical protein VNO77_19499 [Canavalia gladiata]|uniref:Uncharacterized protein n=1 Tax=Canavalia gladiata TaxID=3824 RepID=A0AAN9LMM3_CANGL
MERTRCPKVLTELISHDDGLPSLSFHKDLHLSLSSQTPTSQNRFEEFKYVLVGTAIRNSTDLRNLGG